MNKEKIRNDIKKITKEIIDMLEEEKDLIAFKEELEEICTYIKVVKDLTEKLKGESNEI